jgi:hypothetical protein
MRLSLTGIDVFALYAELGYQQMFEAFKLYHTVQLNT